MAKHWWKILGSIILMVVIPMAWIGDVSVQTVLHETIRNLYFHVTMWFGMIILLLAAVSYAVAYLRSGNMDYDLKSEILTRVALTFGMIGIVTGMIWAYFTWGSPWLKDPQLNGAAVTIMAYFAYFVLRSAITDPGKRADMAAVYGIFAFFLMIVLILIIPRVQEAHSLHPGKGGNPGLGSYKDLSGKMRLVFYPAIIGFTLMGAWIATIEYRIKKRLE